MIEMSSEQVLICARAFRNHMLGDVRQWVFDDYEHVSMKVSIKYHEKWNEMK